ncbi:hypothetical protein LXL04_028066 [Taraxacum kok-saghyz]
MDCGIILHSIKAIVFVDNESENLELNVVGFNRRHLYHFVRVVLENHFSLLYTRKQTTISGEFFKETETVSSTCFKDCLNVVVHDFGYVDSNQSPKGLGDIACGIILHPIKAIVFVIDKQYCESKASIGYGSTSDQQEYGQDVF